MSSISPKKTREIVVQVLYSLDMGVESKDELISLLMKELKVTHQQMQAAYERAHLIFAEKDLLDVKIAAAARDYDFERIGRVERNILRLSIFETLENTLPVEVIVAESYRLATKFSTESGAAFVQAIINALVVVNKDASIPSS